MDWLDRARAQAGVISYRQLRQSGLSHRQISGLRERRVLVEDHAYVYRHRSVPQGNAQVLWAAVLWSGSVVSHVSAGRLWGFEVEPIPVVHLTTGDRRFRSSPSGVVIHRVELDNVEVQRLSGLPVTSRMRTLVDLLRTEPPARALGLLDRAIQRQYLLPEDLQRVVDRNPRRAGNRQLRRLLAQIEPGAHAESERVLHRLLRTADIRGWQPQLRVRLPHRILYLDVGFPVEMIAIEVDGRRYHDAFSDRFEDDRIRQNELTNQGWTILRFTWRRLKSDPIGVVAEIQVALNLARMQSS